MSDPFQMFGMGCDCCQDPPAIPRFDFYGLLDPTYGNPYYTLDSEARLISKRFLYPDTPSKTWTDPSIWKGETAKGLKFGRYRGISNAGQTAAQIGFSRTQGVSTGLSLPQEIKDWTSDTMDTLQTVPNSQERNWVLEGTWCDYQSGVTFIVTSYRRWHQEEDNDPRPGIPWVTSTLPGKDLYAKFIVFAHGWGMDFPVRLGTFTIAPSPSDYPLDTHRYDGRDQSLFKYLGERPFGGVFSPFLGVEHFPLAGWPASSRLSKTSVYTVNGIDFGRFRTSENVGSLSKEFDVGTWEDEREAYWASVGGIYLLCAISRETPSLAAGLKYNFDEAAPTPSEYTIGTPTPVLAVGSRGVASIEVEGSWIVESFGAASRDSYSWDSSFTNSEKRRTSTKFLEIFSSRLPYVRSLSSIGSRHCIMYEVLHSEAVRQWEAYYSYEQYTLWDWHRNYNAEFNAPGNTSDPIGGSGYTHGGAKRGSIGALPLELKYVYTHDDSEEIPFYNPIWPQTSDILMPSRDPGERELVVKSNGGFEKRFTGTTEEAWMPLAVGSIKDSTDVIISERMRAAYQSQIQNTAGILGPVSKSGSGIVSRPAESSANGAAYVFIGARALKYTHASGSAPTVATGTFGDVHYLTALLPLSGVAVEGVVEAVVDDPEDLDLARFRYLFAGIENVTPSVSLSTQASAVIPSGPLATNDDTKSQALRFQFAQADEYNVVDYGEGCVVNTSLTPPNVARTFTVGGHTIHLINTLMRRSNSESESWDVTASTGASYLSGIVTSACGDYTRPEKPTNPPPPNYKRYDKSVTLSGNIWSFRLCRYRADGTMVWRNHLDPGEDVSGMVAEDLSMCEDMVHIGHEILESFRLSDGKYLGRALVRSGTFDGEFERKGNYTRVYQSDDLSSDVNNL